MRRRFAISDIHGCSQTFKALVKKIDLKKKDELYLLGDYINRGPDSSGVLDFIIYLQEKNYRIFPLMGNHEYQLLNAASKEDPDIFFHHISFINNSSDLLNKKRKLKRKYKNFFQKLPFYYELDYFLLAHAGFNFKKKSVFKDKDAMIYIRKFTYDAQKAGGKTIIHGHKPTNLKQIKRNIKNREKVIPLDNACVYGNNSDTSEQFGKLCCLNLDTFKLTTQKNIENI